MPSASATSSFSKRARSYSRPQTPTRSSIYHPSPSRGKPKVLPFPDLSVRAVSRDASRTTSPTETPLTLSPRGSQSGSTIGLASLGLEETGSGSGYFVPRDIDANTSHHHTSSSSLGLAAAGGTETNTPVASVSGTSTPRSPLSRPSFSVGNLPLSNGNTNANPSRVRSFTTPDDMHHQRPHHSTTASASAAGTSAPATPPSILLNPIVTHAAPTTRIEGFNPVPLSPTTTIRPSSAPTNIHIAQPPVASTSTSAAAATILPPTPVPKDDPLSSKRRSHDNKGNTPLSVAISPVRMDDGLTSHLHQSFLRGTCADVRIWVRKWGVGWPVHRMVLVQAGFFHSLFLMGFSETGSRSSRKGKERALWEDGDEWRGEDIELQFDDPNITRAAFEICLSRLYSPYPHLQFPSALLPTPAHPLTPAFSSPDTPDYLDILDGLPTNTYLASPRLLLSLLATTIYLGQVGLMKEVLTTILRTIGPATICRYLNFAIGDGVGEEEWDGQTDEPAQGLGNVARHFRSVATLAEGGDDDLLGAGLNPSRHGRSNRSSTDSTGSNVKVEDDEIITRDSGRRSSRPSPLSFGGSPSSAGAETDGGDTHLPHFYGFASDKIGEACCCFLSRWGLDILDRESKLPLPTEGDVPWRVFASGGMHAKFVRALLSSDSLFVKNEMERYNAARKVLDLRRREWEEDCAGDLGVAPGQAEMDSEEDWEEDEVELEKVFTDGIYYTHMTFEDLSTIAADIDPHTSLPFAPLNVLQAAHWSAADLKSRIISAGAADSPEPDLGLSKTVSELSPMTHRRRRNRSSRNVTPSSEYGSRTSFSIDPGQSISSVFSSLPPSSSIMYHPVPSDDTHRIGAGGLLFLNPSATAEMAVPGIPGMPDLGPIPEPDLALDYLDHLSPSATTTTALSTQSQNQTQNRSTSKPRPQPHGETTYFGLLRSSRLLPDLPPSSEIRWSKVEPFRFSVEFWDVHMLVERERTYSTTHFYAGSWFNVYVQTIRKKDKGVQLGVYLHRQSPGEPFPAPSAPGDAVDYTVSANRLNSASAPGGLTGGAPLGRSVTGQVTVGSPRSDAASAELDEEVRRKEAYRDIRPVTRAYFSISCASALGTALIRFSSAPDNFTLSQSWGWKSSALRSAEYLSGAQEVTDQDLDGGVLGWVGDSKDLPRGGSLRASVVVGVV